MIMFTDVAQARVNNIEHRHLAILGERTIFRLCHDNRMGILGWKTVATLWTNAGHMDVATRPEDRAPS